MSSVSVTDPIRVVIDETSFDFRGLRPDTIEEHLDDFNDTVWTLRADSIPAWKPPMLEGFACADGYELFDFLIGEPANHIDRDTRNRFFSIVDKCPEWQTPDPAFLDVALAGNEPVMAMSIAFALTCAISDHGVACLVFGACPRRGFVTATGPSGCQEIFFFAESTALPSFWRSLYELENVPEKDFFSLAGRAFPNLLFHPDLSFRRFDGAYHDLRSRVIARLAVLNDDFLAAYRAAKGVPESVESYLVGIGISPESPGTHKNEKKMRKRDVSYDGRMVRCEWHTKIEPHRNRIHFAVGASSGSDILIGIFVDHLDT